MLPESYSSALSYECDENRFHITGATGGLGQQGFTDGAGGDARQDVPAWCKRGGCGAVAFTLGEGWQLEALSFAASSIPGKQTVPRAETKALVELARFSLAEARSDSSYVVKHAALVQHFAEHGGPPPQALLGDNADLWSEYLGLCEESGCKLRASKVKAHVGIDSVVQGLHDETEYIGNAIADVLAGSASHMAAETVPVQTFARRHSMMTYLICMRIAIVEGLVAAGQAVVREWEVLLASEALSMQCVSDSLSHMLQASGHQVVQVGVDKFRCMICHHVKRSSQFSFWVKYSCGSTQAYEKPLRCTVGNRLEKRLMCSQLRVNSNLQIGTAWNGHRLLQAAGSYKCILCKLQGSLDSFGQACQPYGASLVERNSEWVTTDLDGYRKLQRRENEASKLADKLTDMMAYRAFGMVQHNVIGQACEKGAGRPPAWLVKIHTTHPCVLYGAGMA
jgi:hypothetical protein